MAISAFEAALHLIDRLDCAARAEGTAAITQHVKQSLADLISKGELLLPDRFHVPRPGGYARRLLHRNPELGYSAVVMTWSPGHCTPLHDHAGMWCVEGVVAGEVTVDRYDLLQQQADRYRFERVESLRAGCGACGSLIPPQEYHVLGNALVDRPAITLHVYGGDMERCRVFEPCPDGWYQEAFVPLGFDE
jgi:predicted metal-dependent enzyme (double-stranded beta helix superfamily)